jgi:hypothetical protein
MKLIWNVGLAIALFAGGAPALATHPNLSDNTGGGIDAPPNLSDNTGGGTDAPPNLSDNTGGNPNLSDNTGGNSNLSDNTGGQHSGHGRFVREGDKVKNAQQLANQLAACASTNCSQLAALIQQCEQALQDLRSSQVTPPRNNPSGRLW